MTGWPAQEEAALREHAAAGMSAARIANALNLEFRNGRTRNAVIGKMGRKCIPHKWLEHNGNNTKPRRKRKPREKRVHIPLQPSLPSLPACDEPAEPVHFMERRHDQCAYPLWGDNDRMGNVCGRKVEIGSQFSFCPQHAAICLNIARR